MEVTQPPLSPEIPAWINPASIQGQEWAAEGWARGQHLSYLPNSLIIPIPGCALWCQTSCKTLRTGVLPWKKKRGNGHEREQEVELQPLPRLGLEGGGFGQVIEKVGVSDVWWGLVLPLALLSRTVRRECFLLLLVLRRGRSP